MSNEKIHSSVGGGGRFRATRRRVAIAAALTSVSLAATSCDEADDEDIDEVLGTSEQEIQSGEFDTEFEADYPASVMLQVDSPFSDAATCSGTLVSPRWVLTAAHCIDKVETTVHRSVLDWTIWVSPRGNQEHWSLGYGLAERTFRHTLTVSGPIWFGDDPSWPEYMRETDIALVRLDERVPHPIGLHAKLPTPAACSNGLWGRQVGFSPKGYDGEKVGKGDYNCPVEPGGWRRRRGPDELLWSREEVGDGSVFAHLFTAPSGQACTGFDGIGTNGDSGGSLFRTGATPALHVLCGVISGDGGTQDYEDSQIVYSDYHTSALDELVNIVEIDHLVREGGYDPETPGEGYVEDSWESRNDGVDDDDGDGIAAIHDNCTSVSNSEQLTTFDDPDKDGIGQACDICAEVAGGDNDIFTNLNREVELAAAGYPVEPTNPDDFPSQVHFEAARATWLSHFRPDSCDPTPVPLVSLHDGIDLPISFPPQPGSCLGACSFELRNEIRIDGRAPTPDLALPEGTNVTLGLRFCDCQDAPASANTEFEQGRQQCVTSLATGCVYDGGAYVAPASKWKQIRTAASNSGWGGTVTVPGVLNREWVHAASTDVVVPWNFTDLGAAVTTTASSQKVKGILWATFQNLSQPVPDLPVGSLKTYGASLGSGNASWRWKVNGPREYHYSRDEAFCRECPMGLMHPYYQISYPGDWRATIETGSVHFPAPDASTLQHYEQARTGAVRHVAASENLRTLARLFPGGASFVRSLGVEGQAVTRVLTTNQLDAMPVRTAWSTSQSGPASATARGYAFSASRQRLFVIGGQQLSGAPTNQAWTLDLGTGAWRQHAIPTGEVVGGVLAASYRWQDGAVYFVDRSGGNLRLRRWNAGRNLSAGVLQTLATFPSSWNPFSNVDLVQTPTGDMLLVAWSGTGTEKTRVGMVRVSKSSTVQLSNLVKSTTIIVAPPGAGATGYTSVARAGIATTAPPPYAASVTYASMPVPVTPDMPTILPH